MSDRLIEHPPSVVLIVRDGDDLVLVRQPRPGANGSVTELPSGKIEPGETYVEAADRELAEECALRVNAWTELGSFWAAPAYSTERVVVLYAPAVAGDVQDATPDPDEQIVVIRVHAENAQRNVEDAISLAALHLWATKMPEETLRRHVTVRMTRAVR